MYDQPIEGLNLDHATFGALVGSGVTILVFLRHYG